MPGCKDGIMEKVYDKLEDNWIASAKGSCLELCLNVRDDVLLLGRAEKIV
jgi:hypothetical protein